VTRPAVRSVIAHVPLKKHGPNQPYTECRTLSCRTAIRHDLIADKLGFRSECHADRYLRLREEMQRLMAYRVADLSSALASIDERDADRAISHDRADRFDHGSVLSGAGR